MAQIEWVHLRLLNWARWSSERASKGLGYPRASAFARAAGAARHGEERNSIPVDSIAADETETAVLALRAHDGALHALIVLYYLRGLTRHDVASRLAIGERRFYQRLDECHSWLARWFNDRQQARRAARAPMDQQV